MAAAESTVLPPEIPYKTCGKCQHAFPATLDYFHKHGQLKSGLYPDCRQCRNAAQRAAYPRHAAKRQAHQRAYYHGPKNAHIKARHRAYASQHPEQGSAAALAYRKRHPGRCREATRKWREAHKEQDNANAREYREKYPERVKASQQRYTKANPAKMAVKNHRSRSRKYALPVHYTAEMWQAACAYFQHACAVCGREEGFFWTLAQDHWIPLVDPACPGTVASNIIPLCHPKSGPYHSCNTTKMKRDPQAWLGEKLGPRKARELLTKIEAFFAYMCERFPAEL